MKGLWNYHRPKYECDKYNGVLLKYAPWSGLRDFAYDFAVCFCPETLVELGSHYGCSAFAFLQAIKDFGLGTKFYAVDTWAGDAYTQNDYQEDIFHAYQSIQDSCFSEQNPRMIRKMFDEAVSDFADGSIDLLHIDGSHVYEDVKNDFQKWKGKVANDGIIWFHDIGKELFHGKRMGSYVLWQELKKEYPFMMELPFSCGLGILFFSEEKYRFFTENVDLEVYQEKVNINDSQNKARIREDFFRLRDLQKFIGELQEQLQVKDAHLDKYRKDVGEKQEYIVQLEQRSKEQDSTLQKCTSEFRSLQVYTEKKEKYIDELLAEQKKREKWISGKEDEFQKITKEYSDTIQGKENYIQELLIAQKEYQETLDGKEAYVQELLSAQEKILQDEGKKERYIGELEEEKKDCEQIITEKENYIQELLHDKETILKDTAEKQNYIVQLQQEKEQCQKIIDGKEDYIQELLAVQEQYQETIDGKESYIQELLAVQEQYQETIDGKESYIQELLAVQEQYQETIDGKESYIQELFAAQEQYRETIDGKESYIQELLAAQEQYRETIDGKESYIQELLAAQEQYRKTIDGKEAYIQELLGVQKQYQSTVKGKEIYIQELLSDKEIYEQTIKGKDEYILELEETLEKIRLQCGELEEYRQRVQEKRQSNFVYRMVLNKIDE